MYVFICQAWLLTLEPGHAPDRETCRCEELKLDLTLPAAHSYAAALFVSPPSSLPARSKEIFKEREITTGTETAGEVGEATLSVDF